MLTPEHLRRLITSRGRNSPLAIGDSVYNLAGVMFGRTQQDFMELEPEERWASPREQEKFWTSERRALGKRIYDGMSGIFHEEFGGQPPSPFTTGMIRLSVPRNGFVSSLAGNAETYTGKTTLSIPDVKNDEDFARVYAHELGHQWSARILTFNSPYFDVDLLRSGAAIELRRMNPKSKHIFGFGLFDEAANELTTMRILHQIAPDLKKNDRPIAYGKAIIALRRACAVIADRMPHIYGSWNDAYETLVKGMYGSGDMLPWYRALRTTYGKDLLREMAILTSNATYIKHMVDDGAIEKYKKNRESYTKLLVLLISPLRVQSSRSL